MPKQTFLREVEIPTIEQFQIDYPHYAPLTTQEEGARLFELIMNSSSFVKAENATELNLPAVTGVAEICSFNVILTPHLKQYIGALVCSLMSANGYVKDKDRAVPHPAFAKGKLYKLLPQAFDTWRSNQKLQRNYPGGLNQLFGTPE